MGSLLPEDNRKNVKLLNTQRDFSVLIRKQKKRQFIPAEWSFPLVGKLQFSLVEKKLKFNPAEQRFVLPVQGKVNSAWLNRCFSVLFSLAKYTASPIGELLFSLSEWTVFPIEKLLSGFSLQVNFYLAWLFVQENLNSAWLNRGSPYSENPTGG